MQPELPATPIRSAPDLDYLNQLNEPGELYTLVDAAGAPEQPRELVYFLKRVGAVNLFGELPEASYEQHVAWMIHPVSDPATRRYVLETFYTQSWRAPFVTWLHSPLSPYALGLRLQKRLDASVMGSRVLPRYYDPRVLPVLAQVLTPSQRASWLALGSQWLYFDLSHRLQAIELSGTPREDPLTQTLAFDDDQTDVMIDVTELGQLIRACCDNHPDTFGKLSFQARHDTASAARQIARQSGLTLFDDYLRVTRLMTALGETTQLPAPWLNLLRQIRAGELTWQQLPALPVQGQ